MKVEKKAKTGTGKRGGRGEKSHEKGDAYSKADCWQPRDIFVSASRPKSDQGPDLQRRGPIYKES